MSYFSPLRFKRSRPTTEITCRGSSAIKCIEWFGLHCSGAGNETDGNLKPVTFVRDPLQRAKRVAFERNIGVKCWRSGLDFSQPPWDVNPNLWLSVDNLDKTYYSAYYADWLRIIALYHERVVRYSISICESRIMAKESKLLDQVRAVARLRHLSHRTEAHHGMCVGADAEFSEIATS